MAIAVYFNRMFIGEDLEYVTQRVEVTETGEPMTVDELYEKIGFLYDRVEIWDVNKRLAAYGMYEMQNGTLGWVRE